MVNYQIQAMTTAVYIYSLWRALSYSTLNPHVATGHGSGTIVPLTPHVLYFQTKTLQSRHYRSRYYLAGYSRQMNKGNKVLPDIVFVVDEKCTQR